MRSDQRGGMAAIGGLRGTWPALLVLALAAAGCATAPVAEAPEAPAPAARAEVPEAVRWVATSAEYEGLCRQIYRHATERLEEVAAGREPGTWAVGIDADETVISNLQYQRELSAAGVPHSSERWSAWVRRREAVPVPGAIPFLERVRALGGRIVVNTNRLLADCPDTEANFEQLGIPYDVILCRGPETVEKEPRWEMAEAGSVPGLPPVEILLYLGDNIQDLPDLGQDLRQAGPEVWEEFGRRYFLLPNPLYGSWERNPLD